jgi:5-methylcytosine-specific restriction endonuclease McrA
MTTTALGQTVNMPIRGIIRATQESAGAQFVAAPGVAERHWRSLAMASYTQLPMIAADKRCSKCGETKPPSEYHRDRTKALGVSSFCKACAVEKARDWYTDNTERGKASRQRWLSLNADHKRETQRAYVERTKDVPEYRARRKEHYRRYHETNADQILARRDAKREQNCARKRAWYQCNKERAKQAAMQRRTRAQPGPVDPETVAYAGMLRHDPCSYCGKPAGTIDHIVPIARGGLHEVDNLTAACLTCNNRKKAMPVLTYLHRSNRREVA